MKSFKESPTTAVFTTTFVVKKKSPILFVYHDEDGDWQFHGPEEDVAEQDMMMVGLGQLIDIDNTILEISDGSPATRKSRSDQWRLVTNA